MGTSVNVKVRESCQAGFMSNVPATVLNNGAHIPQLGFGVFQIPPDETAAAVKAALDIGYRHIDTAEMYGNEQGVGQGIVAAELDREVVFITSKLNNGFHRPDDARRAFDGTLRALGCDYVDLFLIHWPLPTLYDGDFVSTWHVLEEFAADGRARSIGVSNFQPAHLDRLAKESVTVPAVNQVEVHPYFVNDSVRTYGQEHGIATEAWSPIAQGKVLGDPVIERIANAAGRSPAQVVLRWHVQRGDIVIPKSVSPDRMKSNFELFDFELDDSDMMAISALDGGESGRTGPNPDEFAYIPA
ncbi:MAG: 2,5-diketo-D-gluconate reductase [Mycobacterium sp.]|nr:2,5-diketo-D-gluconate reductase [Mycobacterium sp.]